MAKFMAGTTTFLAPLAATAHVKAALSAMPRDSFTMVFAVAGAATSRSASAHISTCSAAPVNSTTGLLPVAQWNRLGETRRAALGVMNTWTSAPWRISKRARSIDL